MGLCRCMTIRPVASGWSAEAHELAGTPPPAASSFGRQPVAPRYAAFLSYSHRVDAELAPIIRQALQRFAKPWYRQRAVRVFLDEATLSANAALWGAIEQALLASEFFVLLASPDAARSP